MGLFIPKHVEVYRIKLPHLPMGDHKNGVFEFADGLGVIVSSDEGWEHVSVSRRSRTPSWEDMCRIKDIFWDKEDCVMELHPPESEYVNCHENVLHMWRPLTARIPMPPYWMVGPVRTGSGRHDAA